MNRAHHHHCRPAQTEVSVTAGGDSTTAASSSLRAGLARGVMNSASFVLALLVPKCPLCVAAWLAGMGAGVAVQRTLGAAFTPGLRPLWVGLLALPLALRLALFANARLRRIPATRGAVCCAGQDDLVQAAARTPESR